MPALSLVHQVRPAAAPAGLHPGLLLLHGMGSNENDMMSIAPFVDPRVVVVSARAPEQHTWGGFSWYDVEREGAGLGGAGIERSIERLSRFMGEIETEYRIDPRRLFVGGFSMGAAMAGAMTLLHPERVAAAIMVSGFLPPDSGERYRLRESAGKPFFQAHGTRDGVIPLTYARMTRDYLEQVPVDLTYREYAMAHEVSIQELTDLSAWVQRVLGALEDATR